MLARLNEFSVDSCSHLLDINGAPHDYTLVANKLGLASLAKRRRNMGANFLKGLLDDSVDSPTLLPLINFSVPQRTSRSFTTFHVPLYTTNYLSNEPIKRIMSNANTDPSFLI